jgi:hypothetical protein
MLIRLRLSPKKALQLHHQFQEYLHAFGELPSLVRRILQQLATEPRQSSPR